ncbi:MAG: hypothetical protein LBQ16_05820 [Gracilibacteraceae bacterium]|jgi:transglutaminase-like putative cysteine protease|nr:hypothetical protein [Gracilibacteraceae bacterium]
MIRRFVISIMFSAALVTMTISVYSKWAPLFVVPVFGLNCLVFCFCEKIKQNKRWGPLLYIMVCLLLLALFRLSGSMEEQSAMGLIYLLKAGELPLLSVIFLALAVCYFITSCVYYFVRVNSNSLLLALIVIVPCMLYASRLTLVPLAYVAIIAPLFIAVIIECRRDELTQGFEFISSRSYRFVLWGCLAALVVLVLLIPKTSATPYDYFRMIYGNYENITLQSGRGDINSAQLERPLLEVRATEHLYLKRQVFGVFTQGSWLAVLGESFFTMREDWEQERARLNVNNLLEAVRQAAADDAEFAARYAPSGTIPAAVVSAEVAEIRHLGMRASYVPHPETSYTLAGLPLGERSLQAPTGEIFLWRSQLPGDAQYSLSYYRQNPASDAALEYLSGLNYAALLDDMDRVFTRAGRVSALAAVRSFKEEWENAEAFYRMTPYPVPERAAELAGSLTQGLKTDYEKAAALVRYFHESGYVYDLDYTPPSAHRTDVEYFIFDSRRGICADYATAMTLMARAAGLNARYVEGFFSPPPDAGGLARVTTGSAHAYVEVFLPGYGWTVFEPTVSYREARGGAQEEDSGLSRSGLLWIIGGIVFMAVAAEGVTRFAVPARREAIFRRRVRGADLREGVLLLYMRAQEALFSRHSVPTSPQTPRMLADFALARHGVDLQPLTAVYERTVFAGAAVSEKESGDALQAYDSLARALRI